MDKYSAHAEINHSNGFYKIGETAVCSVVFYKNGQLFPCDVHCIVTLEDQSVADQTLSFSGEPLKLELKSDRAAWGYFAFEILDPATRKPMSGENLWKHERKPTIVEDIGVMFEPEKIVHPLPPPHDFLEFWQEQLHKLDPVPMNPVLEPLTPPE